MRADRTRDIDTFAGKQIGRDPGSMGVIRDGDDRLVPRNFGEMFFEIRGLDIQVDRRSRHFAQFPWAAGHPATGRCPGLASIASNSERVKIFDLLGEFSARLLRKTYRGSKQDQQNKFLH